MEHDRLGKDIPNISEEEPEGLIAFFLFWTIGRSFDQSSRQFFESTWRSRRKRDAQRLSGFRDYDAVRAILADVDDDDRSVPCSLLKARLGKD